jgi:hypothetical protein
VLEARRRPGDDGDWLVVETDEPALRLALDELLFRKCEGGGHAKRFPAGSLTAPIFERFRDRALVLLRQTARLEPVPWAEALRDSAGRLDHAGIDWWLTGSAALAVRGLAVPPRDLDLVVSEGGAREAASAFEDALIEPLVATEGWFCRWFGRAFIGARVEWVGGVTSAADAPEPTDFGLVAAASLERVSWRGLSIRVPPLTLQRRVSERRGLVERVRAIDTLLDTAARS